MKSNVLQHKNTMLDFVELNLNLISNAAWSILDHTAFKLIFQCAQNSSKCFVIDLVCLYP